MFKKLYSIFFNKCPKCHQGDVFKHKNPYSPIRKFDEMNPKCSHCDEDFKREIGFYYGALYAAYGTSVFWGIGTATILVYFLGMPLAQFFYFLIPSMIALAPWFYRISRLIWLNLFVTFDSEK